MLSSIGGATGVKDAIGIFFAFGLVILMLRNANGILPRDQGREFAVNGKLSAGKARGAGLLFILCFIVSALMFGTINLERIIYLVLLLIEMFTGYLDDASKAPWGELKKGLLDAGVAVAAAVTFMIFNGCRISLPIFGISIDLHPIIYFALAIILIWVSINVTNCTDGVDGLSGTLSMITLASFIILDGFSGDLNYWVVLFIVCVLAYQWYNASPSTMLMGDAGSRAMGFFIAIVAMKSGCPLMFIPFAIMMILDGGLGLLKVSFIRYLHMKNFMKNIRTPLHDGARKVSGWSDPQTVYRFAIIQVLVSVIAIYLSSGSF